MDPQHNLKSLHNLNRNFEDLKTVNFGLPGPWASIISPDEETRDVSA